MNSMPEREPLRFADPRDISSENKFLAETVNCQVTRPIVFVLEGDVNIPDQTYRITKFGVTNGLLDCLLNEIYVV